MPGVASVEKKGLGELEVCSDKSPRATWPLKRGSGGFVSLRNEDVPAAGRSLQRRCQCSIGVQCRGGRESAHTSLLPGHHETGYGEYLQQGWVVWDVAAWRMGIRWGDYLAPFLRHFWSCAKLYSQNSQSKAGVCIQGAWRGIPTLLLSRPDFYTSADKKKCIPWCGWKVTLCRGLSVLEH